MQISMATGEIFNCFATARPMGAIISTVATLSIKAEMKPENREMKTTAHMVLGAMRRSFSAMTSGILEAMKKYTVPMVPKSIISTFQLMAEAASPREANTPLSEVTQPQTRKNTAEAAATQWRTLGREIMRT